MMCVCVLHAVAIPIHGASVFNISISVIHQVLPLLVAVSTRLDILCGQDRLNVFGRGWFERGGLCIAERWVLHGEEDQEHDQGCDAEPSEGLSSTCTRDAKKIFLVYQSGLICKPEQDQDSHIDVVMLKVGWD